ncbi:MAG: tRNA pseudouridine(55) synthase TruB, partial [Dehalococcoidia bacterium]
MTAKQTRAGRPEADGIFVLNKPRDITSMEAVRQVKRVTRVKRVGHAGTLDPIATGVLPVCLGQATRFMEYLVGGRKTYRAEFTLGEATDTYDSFGKVTHTGDSSDVTRAQVEAQFPLFTGDVLQQPPMYSALKHEGKRLYELARAGVEVERAEREVTVYQITLLDWAPPKVTVDVECGKGFYMRTFAHELGKALGCYAHLTGLTRSQSGAFTLEDTITQEQLEAAAEDEGWRELLLPPDAALLGMGPLTLEAAAERHLRNGQAVTVPSASMYAKHLEPRRAYSQDGLFLGILRFSRPDALWQPEKVMASPVPSRHA